MYRKEKNKKDILYILEHLREEDLHELKALRGENWKEAILSELLSNNYSDFVIGCTKKDDIPAVVGGCLDDERYVPYSIGGCKGTRDGIGIVWLLTTPLALKYQLTLLRNIRKDILDFDKKYWLTFNMIYKENFIAKKWLKWLGYRFPSEEKELNFYDAMFLKAVKTPEGFEVFYRKRETRGLK